MTYYRRRGLEWWEEAAAVAVGAAAGVAAGYLARLWLRREPAGGRTEPDADRASPPPERGRRDAGTAGSDPRR